MSTERRFTSVPVEIRAASSEARTIGGYAAKFNRMSGNLGGFIERINPGFFNRSASKGFPGVLARYNHDDNMLLGTSDAGTLRMVIDDIGLDYEVDVPMCRSDVYELVQRRDVQKSSFAFTTQEDDWTTSEEGQPVRTLIQGRLMDVAPVNTPAYEDTNTGLRSLARKFDAPFEEIRSLAAENDLMRLFKRTDVPVRHSPHIALAKLRVLALKS